MANLILNGETLFGSYASDIIDITRAEYDALTPEEKNDDRIYNIIDEDVSLVAEGVDYNHSTSGLNANTVQSGIDELVTKLNITDAFNKLGNDALWESRYIADLNDAKNGVYCIGNDSVNKPPTMTYGAVVSFNLNTDYTHMVQIASSFTEENKMVMRTCINKVWSEWTELVKKDEIKNTFNLTTLHEDITPFTDRGGRPIYHYYIELSLDRSKDVQFIRNLKFDDGLSIREIINYDVMFKLNDVEENIKFKDKICGYADVNNYEAIASVDIRGEGMIVFRSSRSATAKIHVWYTKNS